MTSRAAELIEQLALQPHPEGGHYREVFRSALPVTRRHDAQARLALTTIYFLLTQGEYSGWHRVQADEAWHYHEGEPLELLVLLPDAAEIQCWRLGPLQADAEPTRVVPAGAWQAARPLGKHTLVACSVGPGFEFADFALARDLPAGECPAALLAAPWRQWL